MNSDRIKLELRTVIDFLTENEQYGDNWSQQLEVLQWLFNEADEIERNAGKNQRGGKS